MKQQKPRRTSRTLKAISRAVRAPVRLESLEERRLLTAISVTSANDSGDGTLRAAIEQANGDAGPDTIEFHIAGSGVKQIELMTALPEVTTSVTIDGTTQSGYTSAGGPLIWIDGSAAGNPDGLVISGGHSTVKGLALTALFNGVTLTSAGNDTIQACYIGIDPTDPTNPDPMHAGNSLYGIDVQSDGNLIEGNVIGNSGDVGVRVAGANVTVRGNYIGMAPSGLAPVGNGGDGVFVDGASGGGDTTITGNLLSGNSGNGVHVSGAAGASITAN